MIDYFAVWHQINGHILENPDTFKAVFPKEPSYIFTKIVVIFIVLIFIFGAVANYIKNNKKQGIKETLEENKKIEKKTEKESEGIFGTICMLLFFPFVFTASFLLLIDINNSSSYNVQLEMAQKLQEEKNEIERQRQLFKRVIGNKDVKDFYRTSEKIENFCKFYYSTQDSNFCKDNKANKYTFNLIFQKKYENVNDSSDLENALEYIDKGGK